MQLAYSVQIDGPAPLQSLMSSEWDAQEHDIRLAELLPCCCCYDCLHSSSHQKAKSQVRNVSGSSEARVGQSEQERSAIA